MLTGCTIVAANYLAFARVLARSFRRHHPGARFIVLCIDGELTVDTVDEPFVCWGLSDLGQDDDELATMAGIYSVMEFATAVKPWLLGRLLERFDDGPVVYLDPDIEVYASLDSVVAAVEETGIVVTPHVLRPMPRDGRRPNEADLMSAGTYNLGFLAVGNAARTGGFLAFWAERLRRDALVDPERMLFTDQRWVDLLPMFDHTICRDVGCNVAYWNIWGRELGKDATGNWTVDAGPLRFFHFSGFDPSTPQVLSRHQGAHARVRMPDLPILFELCSAYAQRLVAAGHLAQSRQPYGWAATRRGLTLTSAMRRAYRLGVLDAEAGRGARPPSPFAVDGGDAFEDWLTRPTSATGLAPLIRGRWETEPGLRAVFPALEGAAVESLLDWIQTHSAPQAAPLALEQAAVDRSRLRSRRRAVSVGSGRPLGGVNFYGFFDAEMSIGQLGRSFADAAGCAGISFDTVNDPDVQPATRARARRSCTRRWDHDVNVLCVNADRTLRAVEVLGPDAFVGRVTAGIWSWEAPEFPSGVHDALGVLDEIWVTSNYVADAVRTTGRTPRLVVQSVAVPGWRTRRTRADLGLPEGFLVLSVFDWMSVSERKNPLGMLEAYSRAFGPDDGARLVFKTINGDVAWPDFDALRLAIEDRPDVSIIDRSVSIWELTAYLQHADCLLSLHRSEGFGLILAEAMACATPVIATGHSGNLDFMDASVAHLVPATTVPIPDSVPVYGGLGSWADPDLDAAAALLQQVRGDREGSRRLAERARTHIAETRNLTVAGRALAGAIDELRTRGGDR